MGRNKNKRQRDITSNSQMPQTRTNGVSALYERLALYSLIVPVLISVIFMLSEILGLARFSPYEITYEVIMRMIISYIAPTVFSSSVFMVLQQFFLLVPAGFDPKRGVLLFIATLIYFASYAIYLSGNQPINEQCGMIILIVFFFIVNFYSLQTGKRKLDIGFFSG